MSHRIRLPEMNLEPRSYAYSLLAALMFALVLTQPAIAQSTATSPLASEVEAYVGAGSGYRSLDVEELEAELAGALPVSESVFPTSGLLSPMAKAMLVVEAKEGSLPRTRHHLSIRFVGSDEPPPVGPTTVLFVQLDRYNLGPSVRDELVSEHGAEKVAPLAEFGEGPHVSWRFVMHRVMGHEAALIAAGSAHLDEAALAGRDCLGTPCLGTSGGIEEMAAWHELEPVAPELSELPYETVVAGLPTAAAMLDLASRDPRFDPYEAEVFGEGQVVAEVVIESGLSQVPVIDLALRQGDLPDDSVSAIWQRRLALPAAVDAPEFYRAQAFECRRGEGAWAPPGGFCP